MKTLLTFLGLAFGIAAFGQLDTVNIGTGPGNHDGEILYTAFLKVNNAIDSINGFSDKFTTDSLLVNKSFAVTSIISTDIDPGDPWELPEDSSGVVINNIPDARNFTYTAVSEDLTQFSTFFIDPTTFTYELSATDISSTLNLYGSVSSVTSLVRTNANNNNTAQISLSTEATGLGYIDLRAGTVADATRYRFERDGLTLNNYSSASWTDDNLITKGYADASYSDTSWISATLDTLNISDVGKIYKSGSSEMTIATETNTDMAITSDRDMNITSEQLTINTTNNPATINVGTNNFNIQNSVNTYTFSSDTVDLNGGSLKAKTGYFLDSAYIGNKWIDGSWLSAYSNGENTANTNPHYITIGDNIDNVGDFSSGFGESFKIGNFFYGINGSDTIYSTGDYSHYRGLLGWAIAPYAVYDGNGGVIDGIMSVGSGTFCVNSANDSYSSGNESVVGRKVWYDDVFLGEQDQVRAGYSGAKYIEVYGYHVADFVTTINTNGSPLSQAYFWDYPYFLARLDSPNNIVFPRIDSVSYIEPYTRVYYSFSDLSNSPTDTITDAEIQWVASSRRNNVALTSNFLSGRYISSLGDGAAGVGQYGRSWGTANFGFGSKWFNYGTYSLTGGENTRIDSGAISSMALNNATRVTNDGDYGNAFNNGGITNSRASNTFNTDALSYTINHNSFGGEKFDSIGDAQFSFIQVKAEYTNVGPNALIVISSTPTQKTYAGKVTVVGRQSGGTSGNVGESIMYEYDALFELGDSVAYLASGVNVTTDYITSTGDSLRNGDFVILYNVPGLARPGGTSSGATYEVINAAADSFQISTDGVTPKDLTSQGDDGNWFQEWEDVYFTPVADALVSSSFADDGDVVGNHTTTGIRATLDHGDHTRNSFRVFCYGLSTRDIRWFARFSVNELGTY